jgi:hypothetical protein
MPEERWLGCLLKLVLVANIGKEVVMKFRSALYALASSVLLFVPSIVSAIDTVPYTELSTLCYWDTSNADVNTKKSGKQVRLNEVYIFYSEAVDGSTDILDGWTFVHQNTMIKTNGKVVLWGHIDRYPDNMLEGETYIGKLTEDFYLKLPRDPMAGVFIGEGYLEGVIATYQGVPVAEAEPCPAEPPIQCGVDYECDAFPPQTREYSGQITGYPED